MMGEGEGGGQRGGRRLPACLLACCCCCCYFALPLQSLACAGVRSLSVAGLVGEGGQHLQGLSAARHQLASPDA